ncbi:hypothetical protein, partial [Stenotrophomonas cyclobalanopsidis]|uniref:hypothetical protein n=1 Tax=Stenotrophomonas cyclobalanopsidis TaxID=2771362 RepID=UPI002FD99362
SASLIVREALGPDKPYPYANPHRYRLTIHKRGLELPLPHRFKRCPVDLPLPAGGDDAYVGNVPGARYVGDHHDLYRFVPHAVRGRARRWRMDRGRRLLRRVARVVAGLDEGVHRYLRLCKGCGSLGTQGKRQEERVVQFGHWGSQAEER